MIEKSERVKQVKEEDGVYHKLQEEHVKLLGMREKEKAEMQKLKIQ
jgi:hypothetical protein